MAAVAARAAAAIQAGSASAMSSSTSPHWADMRAITKAMQTKAMTVPGERQRHRAARPPWVGVVLLDTEGGGFGPLHPILAYARRVPNRAGGGGANGRQDER